MVNFSLMFHHKYSLSEIEGMIPWELNAYVKIITNYIEEENRRIAEEQSRQAASNKPSFR